MAPKATKKAGDKNQSSGALVSAGTFDLGSMEKTLAKWQAAQEKEKAAKKEIESCKTAVEIAMAKTGMTSIKTTSFSVDKRSQTRESCSKADLPADIFNKYKKTSTFTVMTLKPLGKAKAKAKK
eukprot:gnl/MRDRNA2_/MRDRNA2_98463_c0_seq1.p2 gnl/MRDRNA2_/MRDRNA2_98463_c0~~gnl/MRDRNA2_/MRDRNA2_98463_c0_seq1.p2  ORF type:complete len:124 (-),score=34.26 gnl/MRDRNA2_/MRDRNA2_98463_c0_seq1:19-390(-)